MCCGLTQDAQGGLSLSRRVCCVPTPAQLGRLLVPVAVKISGEWEHMQGRKKSNFFFQSLECPLANIRFFFLFVCFVGVCVRMPV